MNASATATTGRVGGIAYSVLGSGDPVTVFAHGLGGSRLETRPLAAQVPGTRVLLDLRGHGSSAPLPGGWDYDLLAADLVDVADAVAATCCVGVSVGSGALLRLLCHDPNRFDRIALLLPAAIDAARPDGATGQLHRLAGALDRQDAKQLADALLADLPVPQQVSRAVTALVRRRADALVRRPPPYPRQDARPVLDRERLTAVTARALVVGQAGDALHPLALAEELAGLLPAARLLSLPPGGVFWTARNELSDALAAHLGGSE